MSDTERIKEEINHVDPLRLAKSDIHCTYESLHTTNEGLLKEESEVRLRIFGNNDIRSKRTFNPVKCFVQKLFNLLAVMLWVASVLAYISGTPVLTYVIIAIIVINAVFAFIQEKKADKALQALSELIPNNVKVLRDGIVEITTADQLVPGDVLSLAAGNKVPADCRVIEATGLMVDNSMLTGESVSLNRDAGKETNAIDVVSDCRNLLFAGTSITGGTAKAVVYATGKQSQIGMITETTSHIEKDKSTLEIQIHRITKILAAFAIGIGILSFCVSLFVTNIEINEALIFAIGMIVANIPEGLMPTVSLSLALSVQRMAKKNALVRKQSAVETLSATTVICTDKTGTLTQNSIFAERLWTADGMAEVTGRGYEKAGKLNGITDNNLPALERLFTASIICSDTVLREDENDHHLWKVIGNPTEAALLVAANKFGLNLEQVRQEFHVDSVKPFSSESKSMTVYAENKSCRLFGKEETMAFVKGDPVKIIEQCGYLFKEGQAREMTEADRQSALEINDKNAQEGYRILAVACSGPETDSLALLGLAIMYDPPKEGVLEAVRDCYRAGIKVTIVTGDYSKTALAIAKKTGIVEENCVVITGPELRTMKKQELKEKIDTECPVIFARTTPQDKLMIVDAYQSLGHVVAVTGDGINDVLALKRADIGISMGGKGSDAAIEASDVVLLDDHFSTIVEAIKEGRTIYANIRKFIGYILASNVPEIIPFLVMGLFNVPLALPVLLVLAVDLGTDLLPAISLGKELPDEDVLDQPPRKKESNILDRWTLLRCYGFLGMIEAASVFALFFFVWYSFGYSLPEMRTLTEAIANNTAPSDVMYVYSYAVTMAFGAVVACQVGNLLESRSVKMPFYHSFHKPNTLMIWGIISEAALFLLIAYVPFMQYVFGTAGIRLEHLLLLPLCTLAFILLEETRKWIARQIRKREALF
ncbi:MAG: cation-translocating P-type ATPase [Bacillus sp. (in: firmicutes)]